VTLSTGTSYSSASIPLIHTGAVIWYSGLPMAVDQVARRRDARGRADIDARMAEEARREHRNGDERLHSRNSDTVYDDSDISATSNSR
jgi:hypothetical protein